MNDERLKMKNWKERLVSFVIITVVSLIFFYPMVKGHIPFPGDLLTSTYAPYTSYSYEGYAPGGVPTKDQGPDVIKEIYPWKLFVIDQLKHGQIPFWNPYNFSGNPLMANFQSNVFYPMNSIFFLGSFPVSWTIYIILTPILSGFFLYLYLAHKSVTRLAAVFGGVVFAFSSYMVVWMEYGNIGHTLLWLPLGLYLIDLFAETKKLRYPGFLIGVLLFAFLAGYIQGFFYLTGILFLYSFLSFKNIEKKHLYFLLPLFVSPFMLGAFQLLPTLSLFANSSRGGYTLSQIHYLLNPISYIITVLIPDFFGNPATRNYWFNGTYIERVASIGLIPFWFALSALWHKNRSKEVVFFAFLALLSLVLTTDLLITKYLYLIPIPVISTTVPTRMLSVFVVCASILSGFGMDGFIKQKEKRPIISGGLVIGVVLFLAGVGLLISNTVFHSITSEMFITSLKNVLLASGYFGLGGVLFGLALYGKKNNHLFTGIVLILVLLSLFDLFRFFHRITPFSPREFVYPSTPVTSYLQKHQGIDRSWGYDQGSIESNFQTVDRIYSPEGNDPLHNRQYTEFIMSSKDGKVPEVPARPDANIFNSNTDAEFLHNTFRQKVLNILGIKYIHSKDTTLGKDLRTNNQRFNPETYALVWQDAPWQIYENKSVAPRIFFTSDYVVKSTPQEILNTLFSPAFDEKSTIVLEKKPLFPAQSGKGNVELVSYTPNRVILRVNSDKDGFVFLSDVYTPKWVAKVDGVITPIARADYAFRAIPVTKGEHVVTMSYQDRAFMKGMWISCMGMLLLVGYFAFFRYYKKWQL